MLSTQLNIPLLQDVELVDHDFMVDAVSLILILHLFSTFLPTDLQRLDFTVVVLHITSPDEPIK